MAKMSVFLSQMQKVNLEDEDKYLNHCNKNKNNKCTKIKCNCGQLFI